MQLELRCGRLSLIFQNT